MLDWDPQTFRSQKQPSRCAPTGKTCIACRFAVLLPRYVNIRSESELLHSTSKQRHIRTPWCDRRQREMLIRLHFRFSAVQCRSSTSWVFPIVACHTRACECALALMFAQALPSTGLEFETVTVNWVCCFVFRTAAVSVAIPAGAVFVGWGHHCRHGAETASQRDQTKLGVTKKGPRAATSAHDAAR